MRGLADGDLIRSFMRGLRHEADVDAHVYFTGGVTAVLKGWRESTIDIDVRWEPERDELFRAIPALKERLHVNVELAWPFDFIPEPPGWRDRCEFIDSEGRLQFFHCDLYAQALAKIERGHARDRSDVEHMLRAGLIEPARLREQFEAIAGGLYRFPAIDPASFQRALNEAIGRRDAG